MRRAILLILLGVALALAPSAQACACCAERGIWFQYSERIKAYHLQELNRVRFATVAELLVGPAGFPGVKGISNPSQRYGVSQSRRGRHWVFTFTAPGGRSGTLSFRLPQRAVTFGVDTRDGPRETVYTEYRLAGPVSGTGVFERGMAGKPQFHLILQGRGGLCFSAEQFDHWTLQVSGRSAGYTLFGPLKKPAPS
jgi:hypothetical protein